MNWLCARRNRTHPRKLRRGPFACFSAKVCRRVEKGLPCYSARRRGQTSRVQGTLGQGVQKTRREPTTELGLGLGPSIKTDSFRDAVTKRYTKKYTRGDGELRAEARRPARPTRLMVGKHGSRMCVLSTIIACVQRIEFRPGGSGVSIPSWTREPDNEAMLVERVFIGLYDTTDLDFGRIIIFRCKGRSA